MDLSVAALWNMKGTGSQHVYSFMCYADVVASKIHVKGMLVSASGEIITATTGMEKVCYISYMQSAMDYGQCKSCRGKLYGCKYF
jgi:hypothetical protein